MGEVGALFAAVCWALSAISVQKGVKKISPSEGTLISTIVNVLIFIPLLLLQIIIGREQLPVLTNVEILKGMTLLTMAGFFSVLGKLLSFLSISHIGSNRAMQLRQSEPVFGILIGVIILKEHLFLWQWMGIALVVAGVMCLACENSSLKKGETALFSSNRTGIVIALLAGLDFAVSKAVRKGGLKYYPSAVMASAMNALGAITSLLLLMPAARKALFSAYREKNFLSNRYYFMLAGVLSAAANFSASWALLRAEVSTVTVIGSTAPFFTILFNSIFSSAEEKFSLKIVMTGILIVGGVSLLVFFGYH